MEVGSAAMQSKSDNDWWFWKQSSFEWYYCVLSCSFLFFFFYKATLHSQEALTTEANGKTRNVI